MKKKLMLLVVTTAMFVFSAAATAEVERRTVDASADGNVSISNTAGSVEVTGWSKNEVEVVADLGRDVEELIVERDGNDVVIKVRVPRRNNNRISSDLVVRVPEQSSLEVGTVSAKVDITKVQGEQRVHTVSGDVTSEAFGADVEMQTVSGHIELSGDDKAVLLAQLNSVSGEIEVDKVHGELEVETVSGDVSVEGGSFERVQGSAINGSLEFHSRVMEGGRLDLETINGLIDVRFVGDVSARFDIETFNGTIDNCFGPEAVRTNKYTPGRELRFTEGDGESRVLISTLNGAIRLCRD